MDLDRSFGFLVNDVARLFGRRFSHNGRRLGLTRAQCRTLARIARNEGINQAGLADLLEVRPMTLVRQIDRMEGGRLDRAPPGPGRPARPAAVSDRQGPPDSRPHPRRRERDARRGAGPAVAGRAGATDRAADAGARDPVGAGSGGCPERGGRSAAAENARARDSADAAIAAAARRPPARDGAAVRARPKRAGWTRRCGGRTVTSSAEPDARTGFSRAGDERDVPVGDPARAAPLRQRLRLPLMIAGPVLVLLVAAWWYLTSGRYVSTDDAYVQAARTMVSADVSGRVVAVAVHDNERGREGQVLFRIDDKTFRIAVEEAKAALAAAKLQVKAMQATYNQKLADMKARGGNARLSAARIRPPAPAAGHRERAAFDLRSGAERDAGRAPEGHVGAKRPRQHAGPARRQPEPAGR